METKIKIQSQLELLYRVNSIPYLVMRNTAYDTPVRRLSSNLLTGIDSNVLVAWFQEARIFKLQLCVDKINRSVLTVTF